MSNLSFTHSFLLPTFMYFCVSVLCTEPEKCYVNSKTRNVAEEKFLNKISPLFGQTFRTEKDGFNYVVAICSDTSKLHTNVSVTKSKIKNDTVILGRRNETSLDGGDTWVMLRYECGDKKNESADSLCLGRHSASIYILCDPEKHEEPPEIKLTETDGCNYKFVLPSTSVCEHEEEVSGTTIFLMLLSVALFMYFIVGIVYRRLVHNAQGCQQLPHFIFWQKIGALLSIFLILAVGSRLLAQKAFSVVLVAFGLLKLMGVITFVAVMMNLKTLGTISQVILTVATEMMFC